LKLKEHFKGKIGNDKLEHLGVEQMLILLYGSGLIDSNMYSKMTKIRKKRNDLVHGSWTQHITLDPHDAEGLIKQAIECLEILGAP
jgi:DNA-binding MltR family transcriptional regulator